MEYSRVNAVYMQLKSTYYCNFTISSIQTVTMDIRVLCLKLCVGNAYRNPIIHDLASIAGLTGVHSDPKEDSLEHCRSSTMIFEKNPCQI